MSSIPCRDRSGNPSLLRDKEDKNNLSPQVVFPFNIDLVTVFDAILTSRQTREKLQCLYENLMSNNFRKTAVPKKISIVN